MGLGISVVIFIYGARRSIVKAQGKKVVEEAAEEIGVDIFSFRALLLAWNMVARDELLEMFSCV